MRALGGGQRPTQLAVLLALAALAACQDAPPACPGRTTTVSVAAALPHTAAGVPLPAEAVGPAALTAADVRRGLCQTGAPEHPVVELTIAEAREAMLGGRLSCSGLVAAYRQRILQLDQRLQLNAVLALSPTAAAEAEAADGELAAGLANETAAAALPRLFCVPLLVKDNHDVLGLPTTAGRPGGGGRLPGEMVDIRIILMS